MLRLGLNLSAIVFSALIERMVDTSGFEPLTSTVSKNKNECNSLISGIIGDYLRHPKSPKMQVPHRPAYRDPSSVPSCVTVTLQKVEVRPVTRIKGLDVS